MRYIGSKSSTLPWLERFIEKMAPEATSLCDPFAGTCTVARHFKRRGFRIFTGDLLHLSYAIQVATVGLNKPPSFVGVSTLDGLRDRPAKDAVSRVFGHLNALRPRRRYLSRYFSASAGRMFFTDANAGKIDAVREEIADWDGEGLLAKGEREFLLAALIVAADKVANTAGTYYAHLKQLSRKAKKEVLLMPPETFDNGAANRCRTIDARRLAASSETDILYLDPPYNERDYSGYYHLPESIVRWDAPLPGGKSGSPQVRRSEKSDFCRPGRAALALEEVVSRAKARFILVHYTNCGLIPHRTIMDMLDRRGSTSYRDLPVRAYSSRPGGSGPTVTHRIYWCSANGSLSS